MILEFLKHAVKVVLIFNPAMLIWGDSDGFLSVHLGVVVT